MGKTRMGQNSKNILIKDIFAFISIRSEHGY